MCIQVYHLIFNNLKPINYELQESDYNAPQGWLPRKKSRLFSFLFFSFLFFSFPVDGQNFSCSDIGLKACSAVNLSSTDNCSRIKFPFYYKYIGQNPPQASFETKSLRLQVQIQGDGVFDQDLTQVVGAVIAPPGTPIAKLYPDPKTVLFILPCNEFITQFIVPFETGCTYPAPPDFYYELVVITDPGEVVILQTTATGLFKPNNVVDCELPDYCEMSSDDPNHGVAAAPGCPSDLSVQLVPFYDENSTPPVVHYKEYNPHTEVPVSLKIKNTGASVINLSEADFRIRIEDLYNTLPDVPQTELGDYFLEGTNPPGFPLYESHEGDSHYFYLNTLSTSTLNPGESMTLLNFTIPKPDGLENQLGQADITVEYIRVKDSNGDCCLLDVSDAYGSINFPGILECVQSAPKISFNIQQIDAGGLNDCEAGLEIKANILDLSGNPTSVQVKQLLFELQTMTSGNLQITELIAPSGVQTSFDCFSVPCAPGSSFPLCFGCNATFQYLGPGLTLNHGDSFKIILGGLNGQLDDFQLNQAAIQAGIATGACIPVVTIDPGLSLSLPIANPCNFCDNVTLTTAPWDWDAGTLDYCEAGFSVHLNINGPAINFDEILVELELTGGPLANLQVTPILCNLSGTNSCPQPGQSNCVVTSGNLITYRFCPGYPIGAGVPILNIKFTHPGGSPNSVCVNNVFFTENTRVNIPLTGVCVPQFDMTTTPFPVCSSCNPDVNQISGMIQTEDNLPVEIPLSSQLDPNAPCPNKDPIEGITIRAATESGGGCPCTSAGCPEQVIGTTAIPCGSYSQSFSCSSNYYAVQPNKNVNPLNGVTTFDLVLITKHILGVQLLGSPYKIIAADANKSNTVTTFDLVVLRKLILFIDTEFQNNTSWRFVPKDYVFPDPLSPWGFPECASVDMTTQSEAQGIDFIAIKVGDVNGSVTSCESPNFGGGEAAGRAEENVELLCAASPAKAGAGATVGLYIKSPEGLVAWETGLRFDPAYLQLEEALPGTLDGMTPGNFGLTQAGEGKVRVLWYAPDARPAWFGEARHAFSLRFKVLRPIEDWSSVLTADDSILQGRAYEDDGTEHALRLNFTDEIPAAPGRMEEKPMQVTAVPNPFRDELRLFISVPEDDWIEVSVFDINGRLVASRSGETTDRQKEVLFQQTKSWGSGVFTYRVRTAQHSVTGKIARQ
jgi:hypothetical protein